MIKVALGRVVAGMNSFTFRVKLENGSVFILESDKEHCTGDHVLERYNPADQFAKVVDTELVADILEKHYARP